MLYVMVALFGAGPGLYFDLATLSFQVPLNMSAAVSANVAATTTMTMRRRILIILKLLAVQFSVRPVHRSGLLYSNVRRHTTFLYVFPSYRSASIPSSRPTAD